DVLKTEIINGTRPIPKSVSGTPNEFQRLIERGWNNRPNERPTIREMFSVLNELMHTYFKVDTIDNDNVHLSLAVDDSDVNSIRFDVLPTNNINDSNMKWNDKVKIMQKFIPFHKSHVSKLDENE